MVQILIAILFVPVAALGGIGAEPPSMRERNHILIKACARYNAVGFYKIDARTGEVVERLTADPKLRDKDPRWSPDRRKIAWMRGEVYKEGTTGVPGEIYVMDADGTDRRRVTDSELPNFDPDWSPDSTKLVFERGFLEESDVVTINADGSGERRLTRDDGVDIDPVWSPNGRWIAWASDGAIRKMRADGTDKQKLTGARQAERRATDEAPRWSPAGNAILFVRSIHGKDDWNMELFIVRPNGRGLTRLTRSPEDEYEHSWSPDGTKIVFQRRRWEASDGTYRQHLWVMDADGGNQIRLTGNLAVRNWYLSFYPTWSPNGTRVAYSTNRMRCNRADLWVARADGSGRRRLTRTDRFGEIKPNWYSRGGQDLVF